MFSSVQFSSVQLLSRVQLFATPWTAALQASLSITNFQSPPKPMSISQWCHPTISSSVFPFSSCPQSFPVSGNFQFRWPKYWSFSFNISPSNEHPGLISFRMDWLDLLAYFIFSFTYFINKCQMNTFIDFFTITMISPSSPGLSLSCLTELSFLSAVHACFSWMTESGNCL